MEPLYFTNSKYDTDRNFLKDFNTKPKAKQWSYLRNSTVTLSDMTPSMVETVMKDSSRVQKKRLSSNAVQSDDQLLAKNFFYASEDVSNAVKEWIREQGPVYSILPVNHDFHSDSKTPYRDDHEEHNFTERTVSTLYNFSGGSYPVEVIGYGEDYWECRSFWINAPYFRLHAFNTICSLNRQQELTYNGKIQGYVGGFFMCQL